jgi:hypothetical protein
MNYHEQLDNLLLLKEDWDGIDRSPTDIPSKQSVENARFVLDSLQLDFDKVHVDISADVLGGCDLYFEDSCGLDIDCLACFLNNEQAILIINTRNTKEFRKQVFGLDNIVNELRLLHCQK